MTREQFIAKWQHEWGGTVADALTTDAKGAELSMKLRGILRKIDSHLSQMYFDLTSDLPAPAPTNGKGANHAAPPQEAKPR